MGIIVRSTPANNTLTRETVTGIVIGNTSLVCHHGHNNQHSIWTDGNPLYTPTSLLLFQMCIISLLSRLLHYALQPLGQISVTSQLLAGILLGPSCLGHFGYFAADMFPDRGIPAIETFATFGVMFFIFGLGVKMDPSIMIHPDRKSATIGSLMLLPPLLLSLAFSILLTIHVPMSPSLKGSLNYIAGIQALTGFPVVSYLVTELGILNTDLGRLAISSSMFCDAINIFLSASSTSLAEADKGHKDAAVMALLSAATLLLILTFLIKPIILWIINKTPPGKPMAEVNLVSVYVIVLVTGLVSEIIGQHYILGPLFLGMLVPNGPPLGTAIDTKLEAFVSGLLYPSFLSVNGLQIDLFSIEFESFWIIGLVTLFVFFIKFVSVMVGCLYLEMTCREAIVLALISNSKGIMEFVLLNFYRNSDFISGEAFSLCALLVFLITGIVSPMVKILYDPTRQYVSGKRCTIQQSSHDPEFRIMVCVDGQETVPTIINLLEISHNGKDHTSKMLVVVMALVELVGRTTPVLLSDGPGSLLTPSTSVSDHITNAFKNFGHTASGGSVQIETFTAIADLLTVHSDICQVALDEGTHLVVVPFHKQWSFDGCIDTVKPKIRNMNFNVLENAPCSVGILIDRGPMATKPIMASHSSYHVTVLFIGGPDDAESLAYGCRMVKHENVILTVIRFLLFGNENTKDRKMDTELVNEYRNENAGNERFVYIEELVRDGVGLAGFVREIVDSFDLIMVGRHHQASPIFMGLDQWSECPEIGIVPDMLASPDFDSTASVLVIQQQKKRGNCFGNQPVHSISLGVQGDELPKGPSWAISMDKFDFNPKNLS